MIVRDKARIRNMMNSSLTKEQPDIALTAYEKVDKKTRNHIVGNEAGPRSSPTFFGFIVNLIVISFIQLMEPVHQRSPRVLWNASCIVEYKRKS